MIARLSMFFILQEAYIIADIFTEENRLKYRIYVDSSDRIALPYILRDLGITHIGIDSNLTKEWFSALALLYNEFESI